MSDTLPNEVREAMARAMCSQGGFDPDERMANDGPRWRYYLPGVDAALSALEAAGWVCVPKKPTIAMQEAVARIPIRVGLEYPAHIPTAYVKEILAALLTASNPKEKPDV